MGNRKIERKKYFFWQEKYIKNRKVAANDLLY